MKRFFLLFALLATYPLFGLHVGVGFGWNSVDECFKSNLITNEDKGGRDRYEAHQNRLVPVVTVGHQFNLCNDWVIGFSAEWKYLNYYTRNLNSSRGQILPNATFSSINILGPMVIRDFTSKTHLRNEGLFLGSLGKQICNGLVYLGMGPVVFDSSNSIYVTSVHTPDGVGNHLISTSVKNRKVIWGGAVQVGYQYYLSSKYFINIGYTYLQTGRYHFRKSVNTAILNGFDAPGPTRLFLRRSIRVTVQELAFSINMMF